MSKNMKKAELRAKLLEYIDDKIDLELAKHLIQHHGSNEIHPRILEWFEKRTKNLKKLIANDEEE